MNPLHKFLSELFNASHLQALLPYTFTISDPTAVVILLEQNITKLRSRVDSEEVIFSFTHMYLRYLAENSGYISWKKIVPLPISEIPHVDFLAPESTNIGIASTDKLAILKLNGGLGTTMGCEGAKSAIPIWNNKTFLDVVSEQVLSLRERYKTPFPLVLMNSFATSKDTRDILDGKIDYIEMIQHEFPRLVADSKLPLDYPSKPNHEWAPPGHGDVLLSLVTSGVAEELLESGIEYLLISNTDNLGPSFDPAIFGHMISQGLEFLVEVTPRTASDVKGGTIVKMDGAYQLLERSQIEPARHSDFEDISIFSIFNTNNIWLSLPALMDVTSQGKLILPLIVNPKTIDSVNVVQLESALGSAISLFEFSGVITVHRDRFLPVKKTSDLLIILSDLVQPDPTQLTLGIDRPLNDCSYPAVHFDEDKQALKGFWRTFEHIPSLTALQSLRLEGPIVFGENVQLKGQVTIFAHTEVTISNQVLEDVCITVSDTGEWTTEFFQLTTSKIRKG